MDLTKHWSKFLTRLVPNYLDWWLSLWEFHIYLRIRIWGFLFKFSFAVQHPPTPAVTGVWGEEGGEKCFGIASKFCCLEILLPKKSDLAASWPERLRDVRQHNWWQLKVRCIIQQQQRVGVINWSLSLFRIRNHDTYKAFCLLTIWQKYDFLGRIHMNSKQTEATILVRIVPCVKHEYD